MKFRRLVQPSVKAHQQLGKTPEPELPRYRERHRDLHPHALQRLPRTRGGWWAVHLNGCGKGTAPAPVGKGGQCLQRVRLDRRERSCA